MGNIQTLKIHLLIDVSYVIGSVKQNTAVIVLLLFRISHLLGGAVKILLPLRNVYSQLLKSTLCTVTP